MCLYNFLSSNFSFHLYILLSTPLLFFTISYHSGYIFRALLTSFLSFSHLFLTAHSTSTDSSNDDEVTDLYLVHSNMAILNLVSQVSTGILHIVSPLNPSCLTFFNFLESHAYLVSPGLISPCLDVPYLAFTRLAQTILFSYTLLYFTLLINIFKRFVLLSSHLKFTTIDSSVLPSLLLNSPFALLQHHSESDSIGPREEVRSHEDVTISGQHYF